MRTKASLNASTTPVRFIHCWTRPTIGRSFMPDHPALMASECDGLGWELTLLIGAVISSRPWTI